MYYIYILYYPFPKCAESTGNSPESSVLSGFQGSNRAGLGRLRRRGRGKGTGGERGRAAAVEAKSAHTI
jgi:hypothetical protein